jgi:hypothetical protein
MTAYLRILLFLGAAVVAVFIAILLVKMIVALALLAAVVLAGIYLYHFFRALFRRMNPPAPIAMLGAPVDPAN